MKNIFTALLLLLSLCPAFAQVTQEQPLLPTGSLPGSLTAVADSTGKQAFAPLDSVKTKLNCCCNAHRS